MERKKKGKRRGKIDHGMVGVCSRVNFHPTKKGEFVFCVSCPTFSSDVFTLSLSSPAPPTRWTFSETGGIPETKNFSSSLIRFSSFDSVCVSAYYFPASQAEKEKKKAPVIVMIHGGPASQFRPSFCQWCCTIHKN